jgi:hypothetical protein
VSFTIDIHHHILPDFSGPLRTENVDPVGGITPPPWSREAALSFLDSGRPQELRMVLRRCVVGVSARWRPTPTSPTAGTAPTARRLPGWVRRAGCGPSSPPTTRGSRITTGPASLSRLHRVANDLYQFHQPDPGVPFEDSLGAREQLREQGDVGISNVTVKQIEDAHSILGEKPGRGPKSLLRRSARK